MIVWILIATYLTALIILGARNTQRHWRREAAEALTLPMTMLMSKQAPVFSPDGKQMRQRNRLSMVRVVVGVLLILVWRVLDAGGHFTMPDVWVLLVVAATLPLSDLFSMVPVREGLSALVAVFGSAVAKRTRSTTTTEETTVDAGAPAAIEVDTPDAPNEWADGEDEGAA